jgi:hypothetical protein
MDANPAQRLEEMRRSGEVDRCLDRAISEIYFGDKGELRHKLHGELLVVRSMVHRFLNEHLLNYDIENNDFVVFDTEYDIDTTIPIEVNGEHLNVNLAGRADRVDSLNNGLMRVIDYKTGKRELEFGAMEGLFYNEKENYKKSNIINTLLYAMIIREKFKRDVRPELYYIGYMADEDNSPLLVTSKEEFNEEKQKKETMKERLESYSVIAEAFESEVKNLLSNLYDRTKPFVQRIDSNGCAFCDFISVCNKKVPKW